MSATIPDTLLSGREINARAVSRLCFGTLTVSPLQLSMPTQRAAELFIYAADKGINFFDTASLYNTYEPLRLALRRRELIVATKAYAYDAATAEEAFREAVAGIGREYIDIFLLHEQESEHTLRGHAGALDYFLKKKEQGLIGAVGLSTHYVAGVLAAARHGGLDVVHPMINRAGAGILGLRDSAEQPSPPPETARAQMETAIREASGAGLFVYGMKALAGGHLIASRRDALDYVLGLTGLNAVAVGMQSEEEIDYNAAIFAGAEPPESLAHKENRRLMIHDWCEGCGRCVAVCPQAALSPKADGKTRVDPQKCILCGYCAPVCPQFCVKVI